MARIISDYEMSRRQEMARVKLALTAEMGHHSLTALEWVCVLNELIQRMAAHGLREEYDAKTSEAN